VVLPASMEARVIRFLRPLHHVYLIELEAIATR
jgi:hypothetical protein